MIRNVGPILNSQVVSGDAITRWAANLNNITAQVASEDAALSSGISQAAPTAEALNTVFNDVGLTRRLWRTSRSSLTCSSGTATGPGTDLVIFPQGAAARRSDRGCSLRGHRPGGTGLRSDDQQPATMLDRLPAGFAMAFVRRYSPAPIPDNLCCKIPQQTGNSVRGARNFPCMDVPGEAGHAARLPDNEALHPLGTNPWYGDPNQIVNCPAPGPMRSAGELGYGYPGTDDQYRSEPLAAEFLPPPTPPISDAPSMPGNGTVQCASRMPASISEECSRVGRSLVRVTTRPQRPTRPLCTTRKAAS